jgi:hypothetical protein
MADAPFSKLAMGPLEPIEAITQFPLRMCKQEPYSVQNDPEHSFPVLD